ncbi:MAG: TorF family putative porin [Burkholderiales bacterium]|nr:TorF family putative porin [Burkholderiales bacterium]
MIKRLTKPAAFALTLGVGLPALADGPHSLTGNLSFTNDYRYRGVSQTFKEPAIQGGLDYSHKSGFYLGTWASNVSEAELAGANMEWDFYGGYNASLGKDLSLNVGGLYYFYPGKDKAAYGFDPNTFELYAGVTWKWLNVKYSHTTTKWFGVPDSTGSGYLEANATFTLPGDFTLGLHYGYQAIAGSQGGVKNDDYADWKVSLSKELMGFNVSLAYVDTDIKSTDSVMGGAKNFTKGSKTRDLADATLLISIGKSF